MKELDKNLYIQHAKRLSVILNENSTFLNFLNRKDFKQIIQNELNVLCACEKIFPKIDIESKLTSKILVKKFNKLVNENFKINENQKYEDKADLIDEINYLVTFCSNIFKVNIDDLVAGKNVTATNPQIDLKAKYDASNEGPKMNRNFAFAGGIPLASTPYENPYLIGKAYAKLSDDMKQGSFYQYKTKPRIIPIVKWVSVIGMLLVALAALIASILIFIASPLQVVVQGDSQQETVRLGRAIISSGVMYIILALFAGYPCYVLIKGLIGKNLNLKFNFKWGFTVIFILLTLIVVMPDMRLTWFASFIIPDSQQGSTSLLAYNMWKIMYIIIMSCLILVLIPIVIGSVFNPKPDTEAIERKIKEYIDLFSAETGTNPVPPKADIQQPVDDKPSKSKDNKKK